MGVVYVAWDTKFAKRVALKLSGTGSGSGGMAEARFRREARIGNELGEESGFVRAFDWGEAPPAGLYLAMDLIEDATELDLRSGPLDERLRSLCAAAELVARAHARGVIHRDLKPGNFLQAHGELYLTDFGIARFRDDDEEQADDAERLTRTGVGMGTPAYTAPEQFADAKRADERADVYALGVLLFRALTGAYPYTGHSVTEIMRKQVKVETGAAPPPRPRDLAPDVPPDLDALCAEAIALDPAARLASAQAMVDALRRHLGRAPSAAESAPTLIESDPGTDAAPALGEPRRRSPVAIGLVVLVALGLLAWAVALLRGPQLPTPPPLELEVVAEATGPDERWTPLTAGATLHSGDGFRLRLRCDRAAYLYVLNVDASGGTTLLYPYTERFFPELARADVRCANPVAAGSALDVPPAAPGGEPYVFWLDAVVGREALYVVAAPEPFAPVEEHLPSLRAGGSLRPADRDRLLALLDALRGAATHPLRARGVVVRWLEFEHR